MDHNEAESGYLQVSSTELEHKELDLTSINRS